MAPVDNVNWVTLQQRYNKTQQITTNPYIQVGNVNQPEEYFGGTNYNVTIKDPDISNGTYINGLGNANDAGNFIPYFA